MPETTTVVPVPGADLAVRRWPAAQGESRRTIVCLHETGATAASWQSLAGHLADRAMATELVAFDRRGWGDSTAPEPYTRTTVAEQAQDVLLVLESLGTEKATICGAGLGAVAAIDLALREPSRVVATIAIEPPVLALVEGATEGLSRDAEKLREAFEESRAELANAAEVGRSGADTGLAQRDGRGAATELFLAGELPYLAPGSGRLAARERPGGSDGLEARRRPGTLFAELGAVPTWTLPFEALAESTTPIVIVTGEETPPPVRAAANALATYAPSAELMPLPAADPLLAPDLAQLAP